MADVSAYDSLGGAGRNQALEAANARMESMKATKCMVRQHDFFVEVDVSEIGT